MTGLVRMIVLAALCVLPAVGVGAQRQADLPLLGVLQSELRRNFDVLKQGAAPAYFLGYTVHDERTAQIVASLGALDRSDESRGRFGAVEVRVGDHTLDNTRPI